jgi:hypothetical protein
MAQNWNNIIQYVKINFGTKTSTLEITDDEFFEYFKEHSLPYFSQIIPKKAWITISKGDIVHMSNSYSNYTYKLKIPEDIELIDINEIYFSRTLGSIISSGLHFINPVDSVIANTYHDMHEHLTTVNDYHFIKPDHIRFSEDFVSDMVIAEINIEHNDLKSIPSDVYHKLFKPMCLMHSIELVLNNRNKFTNMSTPFGEIDLNINQLESRLQELRQKTEEIIDQLPHRKFVEFF